MAGVRIVSGPLPFASAEEIDRAADGAVRELSTMAVSRVKEVLLTARDSRGFVGRKDTGLAHSGVGATAPVKSGTATRAVVAVGPPRDEITAVLEDGRRPGSRPPPSSALVPWVRRKLKDAVASGLKGARVTKKQGDVFQRKAALILKRGGSLKGLGPKVSGVKKETLDKAIASVAFLVARSIGRKGIPGLHPFESARKLVEENAERVYLRHLKRVLGNRMQ